MNQQITHDVSAAQTPRGAEHGAPEPDRAGGGRWAHPGRRRARRDGHAARDVVVLRRGPARRRRPRRGVDHGARPRRRPAPGCGQRGARPADPDAVARHWRPRPRRPLRSRRPPATAAAATAQAQAAASDATTESATAATSTAAPSSTAPAPTTTRRRRDGATGHRRTVTATPAATPPPRPSGPESRARRVQPRAHGGGQHADRLDNRRRLGLGGRAIADGRPGRPPHRPPVRRLPRPPRPRGGRRRCAWRSSTARACRATPPPSRSRSRRSRPTAARSPTATASSSRSPSRRPTSPPIRT